MDKINPPPGNQSLIELLKKFTREGWELAHAELNLARAEATTLIKDYVIGAILCAACFVVAIATVVMLAQSLAVSLELYFRSPLTAYSITSFAMVLLTALLAWLGVKRFSRSHEAVGSIFRLLNRKNKRS